ncbi:MAG: squalene/phytoene synthase family protein, partial [Spirochaetota bacterium]
MMNNHETGTPVVDAPEGHLDVERVFDLLRATSRTFTLSIEGLPTPLREQIAVAYLLLRVSDYLEDHETLDLREKVRLLKRWENVLSSAALRTVFRDEIAAVPHREEDPEAVVVREFELLLDALAGFPEEARRAIIDRVRETTLGMARWQAKGPVVEDEADLDDYMHHVAGLV